MRNFVKWNIIFIINVIAIGPLFRWLLDPSIDLSGVGAYIAGLGVPLGTLIAALEAGKRRKQQ
jgi:hypothetical protein